MSRTDAILKRLATLYPKFMDLSLDRQWRLLGQLGNPQERLPPVIHVAGTNAKGSTIAYLRAMLEAAGKRVHVYTSPHLVRFNERIRLAGKLVSTRRVNDALEEVERVNAGAPITQFEITTSAALKLFAETPADYLLLEVGLGGDFDSTNVINHPLGVIITPVDFDHQKWLGYTIREIASHKAGILKRGSPAVIGRQRDEGLKEIERAAAKLKIVPFVQGRDYDGYAQDGRLIYQDEDGLLDLPPPALIGHHQFDNAALAIAAVRHFKLPVSEAQIGKGLRTVVWPARIQPLKGKLRDLLPKSDELWLDGAHNAHGAAALAVSLEEMNVARPKPLVLDRRHDEHARAGGFPGALREDVAARFHGEHSGRAECSSGALHRRCRDRRRARGQDQPLGDDGVACSGQDHRRAGRHLRLALSRRRRAVAQRHAAGLTPTACPMRWCSFRRPASR